MIALHAGHAFGGHEGHLLMLLGAWLVAALGWQLREDLKRRVSVTGLVAATATTLSACLHALVAPEHFEESLRYGTFFVVLALAQLAWSAAYLRRPNPRLLVAGAVVSALVVALWAETRFVGAGFGPLEAGTEELGWPDVLSTLTELVLVVLALRLAVARAGARLSAARSGRPSPAVPAAVPAPAGPAT